MEILTKSYKRKEDCVKLEIVSFDRKKFNALVIHLLFTVKRCDELEVYRTIEDRIVEVFKNWLNNQEKWEKKNYIKIFEYPQTVNNQYKASTQSYDVQYYIHTNKCEDWKTTIATVIPVVELAIKTFKSSCDELGLTLKKWKTK